VKTRSSPGWRYAGGCGLILLVALTRWVAFGSSRSARAPTVVVTVDARRTLGTIPTTALGVNTTVWDNHLRDAAVPSVLRQAGVSVLRFPGGSSADNYHWQTNSFCNGGYANPNNTFDAFIGVARATGAQPLITVNYGSNITCNGGGNPAEAAAWVRYANVTKGYGVKYWEIGNEVYGNGTYPGGWETDLHPQKGPAAYASNAATFIDAMKAADPSIKVGVALTTPGYWPDGQTPNWNTTVLDGVCAKIDFVDVHWYPINDAGTDADLLASTGQIAGMMSTLRAALSAHCGARAAQIQILLGEMNTNSTGKQRVGLVDALFLADGSMTWLEDGAANASWWDLHNGIDLSGNNSVSLYGAATYGDLGVLSNGDMTARASEPPANTPFPPYYGMQMLTKLGMPGDTMVSAQSEQSVIAAHAVRQANGNLALLLVNKSPNTSYDVNVALSGYTPIAAATVFTYGMNSERISSGPISNAGTIFVRTIPPYSLTTVVLRPATPASQLKVTISGGFVTMPSLAPGGATTLGATVTTTAQLNGAVVDFYIYDATGKLVDQTWRRPVTLVAGPQNVTVGWTAPPTMTPGTYTLKVAVFRAGWSLLYAWDSTATTFTVS